MGPRGSRPLPVGVAATHRLGLTFPKRTIFDFTHLLPPYGLEAPVTDRVRWQLKEAIRNAVLEKRTADECIISFAELLVLCGCNGEQVLEPLHSIELAERYYKRLTAWKSAPEAQSSEESRITLSKEVYASENQILHLLQTLRDTFSNLAGSHAAVDGDHLDDPHTNGNGNGNGNGGHLSELMTAEALYLHRRARHTEFKQKNAFEEAYISFKERVPEKVEKPVEDRRDDRGNVSMDALLQFVTAMGMMQGAARQKVLDDAPAAAAALPQPTISARKLRKDAEFTVQDKDRIIQVIYGCEANGVRFEKDYETLEAMVYTKPHQVVSILSQKVEDPVFYAS